MAGHGPPPKPADKRARRNTDPIPMRLITVERVSQPALPKACPVGGDETVMMPWPDATVTWWAMWRDSPLSAEFTATDWSELLDAAILHARLWSGDSKAATELRLRVSKFGATPEDRARLRITLVTADDVERRAAARPPAASSGGSRARRGPLTVAG